MNALPTRSGHRTFVWPCLVMLALALAALATPASAAPMRDTRPSDAFRMLAREIKNDMQAGDYIKAENGARRLYSQYAESGNGIESATSTTLLGRVLREQGKYAEAETLLRQALARRDKLLGKPTTKPSATGSCSPRRSFRKASTPRPMRRSNARWMPSAKSAAGQHRRTADHQPPWARTASAWPLHRGRNPAQTGAGRYPRSGRYKGTTGAHRHDVYPGAHPEHRKEIS